MVLTSKRPRSKGRTRCQCEHRVMVSKVMLSLDLCCSCSRPWGRYIPQTETVSPNLRQSSCFCWPAATGSFSKMALVEQGNNAPAENCHRLVILGSSKVGKTSIVSRFLYNKFEEKYTPTIEDFHRKIYRIKGNAYRLDILDTSGNHPFPAMRRLSLITGESIKIILL